MAGIEDLLILKADIHEHLARGLHFVPNRDRDIKVFMWQYLREADGDGRAEVLDYYLDNLTRCVRLEEYSCPFAYTDDDVVKIGAVISSYIELMKGGRDRETCAHLSEKLLTSINWIDAQPGKRIMNEWLQEAVGDLVEKATQHSMAIYKEHNSFERLAFGPTLEMEGM